MLSRVILIIPYEKRILIPILQTGKFMCGNVRFLKGKLHKLENPSLDAQA